MKKELKGNLILLVTAMVWGMGFVAQKAGAALEPFTYNGIRMILAGTFLIPVIAVIRRKRGRDGREDKNATVITSIKGGICCGVVLCFGANLQQFGIYFQTDASKAGFITALYILIVPILCFFLKKKVSMISWVCVFLGMVGFYCLTMAGKGRGGIWPLVTFLFFSALLFLRYISLLWITLQKPVMGSYWPPPNSLQQGALV